MKTTIRALLAAMAFLAFSCDPGMTIRQAKSSSENTKESRLVGEQVLLDIKTSHPLIGETWYVPQVRVTNSSNSSVTVTGVELISRGGSYTNKPRRSGDYPLVVQPGQTEDLPIWFDLSDSVKETFQQPAELRVHYRKGNKEGIAYATIVGGPLHVNGTS